MFVGTIEASDWTRWPALVAERFRPSIWRPMGMVMSTAPTSGCGRRRTSGVGGFALVDCDEDVDLVARLRLAGTAMHWSAQAPVSTSIRRRGRATGGFADYLGALESAEEAS